MSGPLCKECGATTRTEFPMLPKTLGYRFGEICAKCDRAPCEYCGERCFDGEGCDEHNAGGFSE